MILITGAATRIGAAIARGLAQSGRGDGIVIHYNTNHDAAKNLTAELRALGATVTLWQQDLRAPDLAVQFQNLVQRTGGITTLINNAAVFYPSRDRLGEVTPELWQEVMAVNCHAPFILMQAFAHQLSLTSGESANYNIINILDQRVLNVSHAFPAYTASKSALWALTQNMSRALAPNIRVNAIAPGHVLPNVGEEDEKFRARQAKTPLGTGPSSDEIAAVVAFILNSPSMTGAIIPLDGGEHLIGKSRRVDE